MGSRVQQSRGSRFYKTSQPMLPLLWTVIDQDLLVAPLWYCIYYTGTPVGTPPKNVSSSSSPNLTRSPASKSTTSSSSEGSTSTVVNIETSCHGSDGDHLTSGGSSDASIIEANTGQLAKGKKGNDNLISSLGLYR